MQRFIWFFSYSFMSPCKKQFLETMIIAKICWFNDTTLNLFKVSLSLGRVNDNEMWFKN